MAGALHRGLVTRRRRHLGTGYSEASLPGRKSEELAQRGEVLGGLLQKSWKEDPSDGVLEGREGVLRPRDYSLEVLPFALQRLHQGSIRSLGVLLPSNPGQNRDSLDPFLDLAVNGVRYVRHVRHVRRQ
jgi:hypothetical protein